MQNILAKIGAFFEAHVEKIILIIAGILGLWLLMVFVVMSPNSVSYDNTSFSPGSIDAYVYEKKAKLVQDELNQSSTASDATYSSKLTSPIDVNDGPLLDEFNRSLPDGFMGLLSCSIDHIDSGVSRARPVNKTEIKSDGRQYALPYVGSVTQVQVGHIRAAAYMPFEAVTDESDYQSVEHEVNDVDLVTVQARYDVASLRARFYDSFAGGSLNAEWRDERLAKPVFAAVNLQRREPMPDNSWSPWGDVRHIATLPRSETYSVIENVSDLPAGGVRLRMIRLNEEAVRTNILQSPAYEIASTYEEWLPPEFHGKYLIERQKEISQKRREERESERNSQRNNTSARGRARGGLTNQQGTGGRNSGMGTEGRRGRRGSTAGNDRNSMSGTRNSRTGNDRNSRRGARGGNARGGADDMYGYDQSMQGGASMQQTSPLDELFQEFDDIRLSPMKDFERLDEIVFWAHDDSMEPGKQYQYRIRLGVLNPVAGLGQVSQKDSDFKDQVILWSDFSTQTELVGIPKRLYFFANTFQEVSNAASIEVAKFDDGYWRSSLFSVKPGEAIGRPVEIELEEDENDPMYSSRQMMPGLLKPEPLLVDFTTNVMFVGADQVNKWIGGKNLRSQVSRHMLCSVSGQDIQRVPIGAKNWPKDLFTAYGTIKKLQKEPIEDYRSFGSSRASSESNRFGTGGGMDLYGY
jgi:hypothetical protein